MEYAELMDQIIMFVKVLAAMVLGGIVGFERELSKRPAGLRAHMVVAGASALLVRLGEHVVRYYQVEGLGLDRGGRPF